MNQSPWPPARERSKLKSGRMCLDTVSNYVKCMHEYVAMDVSVTPKDVRNGEKILNNYARTWVRMCDIGGAHNHQWRTNRAIISNFTPIPQLIEIQHRFLVFTPHQ